jgi:hypothetical protein
MSLEKVLNNWKDYDRKKSQRNADPHYFLCEEEWEREYLKNKIVAVFPSKSDNQVLAAILFCCQTLESPLSRKIFVSQVLKKLEITSPTLTFL